MDINEAREIVMDKAREPGGTVCLCCSKHVQVYHRKFNSRMASILMAIFREFEAHPGKYLEVGNYCAKKKGMIAGEHGKLVLWGLLEKKPGDENNRGAKTHGLYRMTQRGFDFVYNRISIPSHVYEYNNVAESFEGEIRIAESLGESFNYPELMNQDCRKAG